MDVKAYIAGLLEERRGYVLRGLDDRVEQVDAELARLESAVEVETPESVDAEVSVEADIEVPAVEVETPESGKRKR